MRSQPLGSSDVPNVLTYAPPPADSQAPAGNGFGSSDFLKTMGPQAGSQLQQSTFGPAPFGTRSAASNPAAQGPTGGNDLNSTIDKVIMAMQQLMQALMALKQPAGTSSPAQPAPSGAADPNSQPGANSQPPGAADPNSQPGANSQPPGAANPNAQPPASAGSAGGTSSSGSNMDSIMKLLEMLIQLITQMVKQMNVNGDPPGGADKSIQQQAAVDPTQSQQGA
jgi:hypothetical protein